MKIWQFNLTEKKQKTILLACLSFALLSTNPIFAQTNDAEAFDSLRTDLKSAWSNNDQNPLSEKVREDKKSQLEAQERALLEKLNSNQISPAEATSGSLKEPSLISLDDNQNLKAKTTEERREVLESSKSKIEVIQDIEAKNNIRNERPVQSDPQLSKVNQAQAKKISDLEYKVRLKDKELEETRGRLLLAETQVERLSTIIEKSNRQQMAGYLGQSDSNTANRVEVIKAQPARVTQAVSNVNKPAVQEDTLIGVVDASKAYLRSGPSTNDSPIMTVSRGTRLVVETRNKGWYRVITPTGSRAWISTDMLKFGPGAEPNSDSSVRISGYDQKQK